MYTSRTEVSYSSPMIRNRGVVGIYGLKWDNVAVLCVVFIHSTVQYI